MKVIAIALVLLTIGPLTASGSGYKGEALVKLNLKAVDMGILYLADDGVYQETNGSDGLQRGREYFRSGGYADPDQSLIQ